LCKYFVPFAGLIFAFSDLYLLMVASRSKRSRDKKPAAALGWQALEVDPSDRVTRILAPEASLNQ
jgi:hypothetical protein